MTGKPLAASFYNINKNLCLERLEKSVPKMACLTSRDYHNKIDLSMSIDSLPDQTSCVDAQKAINAKNQICKPKKVSLSNFRLARGRDDNMLK